MSKTRILLTGASGSMGMASFKALWEKRERYDIVLLLRPSVKNKKLFKAYETEDGGRSLHIVWGDLLDASHVKEACRGIDICLHTAALISPEADRQPELAEKINHLGTRNLVEAIEAEDPERIRMVNIGSVAMYGDRIPPVHRGRTGDPLVPSIFDYYALSKMSGELALMQSRIRHRASLRQTFIMIPDLFSLMDPIMFHQPVNSCMENITARDSGRMMAACVEVPLDSDFWGGYYNIGGGPACQTTYLEFLDRIYTMLGLRYRKVMRREWFALKNFHMLYYEDSAVLDSYLHTREGGQDLEDFHEEVWKKLPGYLKMSAWCCKHIPPVRALVEGITYRQLKGLAERPGGSLRWKKEAEQGDPVAREHMEAFFGSMEAADRIPGWDEDMPSLDPEQPCQLVDHGYDEEKAGKGLEDLDLESLEKAADFRGGKLTSPGSWKQDPHQIVEWQCGLGHSFQLSPHAMLKGGHWCPACVAPPRDGAALADSNPFAAQVLRPGS